MPSDRYYHPQNFQLNQELVLEGIEAHHLASVMRNRLGDIVELVNGQGQLAQGKVSGIEKNRVRLQLTNIESEKAPKKQYILAQAMPKMNRLEYILEKACELGLVQIWLFPGIRSEKYEISTNRFERMQHILISAMKQSGQLFLPQLVLKPLLRNWSPPPFPALFGDTRDHAPSFETIKGSLKSLESLIFFIGPESGFAEEEVSLLEKQGSKGVKLHQNILRTDTAAIIACYLMSQSG